jgi:hypothetical protein
LVAATMTRAASTKLAARSTILLLERCAEEWPSRGVISLRFTRLEGTDEVAGRNISDTCSSELLAEVQK